MDDIQAYRQTTFEAETPVGRIEIRPGQRDERLERLLEFCEVDSWAFVTAWNPGGTFANEEENRRRQEELDSEIDERGYRAFPGRAMPDPAEWAPEQTLLVAGIERDEAIELAEDYDQDALVWGERGGAAQLVECETGEDLADGSGTDAPQGTEEMDEVLEELGGTVQESIDRYRSEPPESMANAVDWEIVLRSLDDDYPDPDLD